MTLRSHHIDRPDCPKAYSVSTFICPDPECGLHLVAWGDASEQHPLCEIVIGRDSVRGLLRMIHDQGLDL